MVNVLFYLLLMFMLFTGGQQTVATPSTPTPPSDPAEFVGVPLGEPFALKWGHPGAVGDTGVIVMFDGIVVDPRRPAGSRAPVMARSWPNSRSLGAVACPRTSC